MRIAIINFFYFEVVILLVVAVAVQNNP